MKKIAFALLLVVGVIGFVGAQPASAQDSPAIVSVSFPFIVGAKVLPAGTYRITVDSQERTLLLLQNTRENAAAVFVATGFTPNPNAQDSHVEVSFKSVDGHMFLAQVAMPGSDARFIALTKAGAERTLTALNLMPPEPRAADSGR